jgi:hypothetical protein
MKASSVEKCRAKPYSRVHRHVFIERQNPLAPSIHSVVEELGQFVSSLAQERKQDCSESTSLYLCAVLRTQSHCPSHTHLLDKRPAILKAQYFFFIKRHCRLNDYCVGRLPFNLQAAPTRCVERRASMSKIRLKVTMHV